MPCPVYFIESHSEDAGFCVWWDLFVDCVMTWLWGPNVEIVEVIGSSGVGAGGGGGEGNRGGGWGQLPFQLVPPFSCPDVFHFISVQHPSHC